MRMTFDDYLWMATTFVLTLALTIIAIEVVPVSAIHIHLAANYTWYGARAAGMVAYLLAAGSVLLGMAASTRFGGKLIGNGNLTDAHRALSLLSLVAIGAHTLFLALDQYAKFGLSDLFIPFATWYMPFWTGLGIIAAYIAVIVYLSFYVRPYIGYKAWRAFHYLAFAVFVLGAFHGIMTGADSGAAWAVWMYASTILAVGAMFVYRVTLARIPKRRAPLVVRPAPVIEPRPMPVPEPRFVRVGRRPSLAD